MERSKEFIAWALSHAPLLCEEHNCKRCKAFNTLMREDLNRLDAGLPSNLSEWMET